MDHNDHNKHFPCPLCRKDTNTILETSLFEHCDKIKRSFSIKFSTDSTDCSARGIAYLTSGHIVVSDYNNRKLKLFTNEGEQVAELTMPGYIGDLCRVNDTTVGVVGCCPNYVGIVQVKSGQLIMTSEITIRFPDLSDLDCYGITYADDTFFVCSPTRVTSVSRQGVVSVLHTGTSFRRLVYLHGNQHVVASCYSSGSDVALWRPPLYKQASACLLDTRHIKGAQGVDTDSDGDVYVCGSLTNNVLQVSGDGSNIRELLTSRDGLDCPEAIAVCGDTIVVTNLSKIPNMCNKIQLFRLN